MSEIKITSETGTEILVDENGIHNFNKPTSEIIEQLQQENKELKERLDTATQAYLNAIKYGSNMEDKYITSNYILNELESWLEEKQKDFTINGEKLSYSIPVKITYNEVLEKLKELEGSDE